MESSDSQFSEIIKQGRMNETQDTRETQDFSQNTKQKIEKGEYQLPGLSQDYAYDFSNEMMENSGVECLRKVSEDKNNSMFRESVASEKLFYRNTSSVSLFSSHQPSQKKRTNRIYDNMFESNNNISLVASGAEILKNTADETILDKATHYINDSWKQEQSVDLLSVTFESNATVSQHPLGSQTIPYLRNRTEEEQKKHKLEKKQLKASKRVKESRYENEFEAMFQVNLQDPPMETPIDYEDRDIFADEEIDQAYDVLAADPVPEEEQWISVRINETKIKKLSDYATKTTDNGETFLWARSECAIPLEVRWKVSLSKWKGPLALRVRFVNYDKKTPLGDAIESPLSDVKKCRKHTEEEASGVPAESFFYINSPGAEWKFPRRNKNESGHFFRTSLPNDATGMDFDIKFSCQEKCMDLEAKRKKMCLVVFLEDEQGTPILHDLFKEVRIVAYPRRDFKNFCARISGEVVKTEIFDRNQPSASDSHQQSPLLHPEPSFLMNNVTNTNQMFPSTSQQRKRGASDMDSSSMPSVRQRNEYQKRLMLGQNDVRVEPRNDIVDENMAICSKRSRARLYPFTTFAVPEKEAEAVAEFLATRARTARAEALRTFSTQQHPFLAQSDIGPDTLIETWLTTLRRSATDVCFKSNGIITIGHLIEAFERDPEVFEKIGIPPNELHLFNDIFLNFYRIFYVQRLTEAKRTQARL